MIRAILDLARLPEGIEAIAEVEGAYAIRTIETVPRGRGRAPRSTAWACQYDPTNPTHFIISDVITYEGPTVVESLEAEARKEDPEHERQTLKEWLDVDTRREERVRRILLPAGSAGDLDVIERVRRAPVSPPEEPDPRDPDPDEPDVRGGSR